MRAESTRHRALPTEGFSYEAVRVIARDLNIGTCTLSGTVENIFS